MAFEIDYNRKPECGKEIILKKFSDSMEPVDTIRVKCRKDKEHDGEHAGEIWSLIGDNGKTHKIVWYT